MKNKKKLTSKSQKDSADIAEKREFAFRRQFEIRHLQGLFLTTGKLGLK